MKTWSKYFATDPGLNSDFGSKDTLWSERKYQSKNRFFQSLLISDSPESRRLKNYESFIRTRLAVSDEILSVGSGLCVNELWLMESGFQITCSDIREFSEYEDIRQIFPNLNYFQLDIVASPSNEKYDAILSLSTIYQFDQLSLARFFDNVRGSLKPGGRLLLDSAGCPDNRLSRLLHGGLLRVEQRLVHLVRRLVKRKPSEFTIQRFGYLRSDGDTLKIAADCGFRLQSQENYDYLTDFERSLILRFLIRRLPFAKIIFQWAGKSLPYTRMYELVRA